MSHAPGPVSPELLSQRRTLSPTWAPRLARRTGAKAMIFMVDWSHSTGGSLVEIHYAPRTHTPLAHA